MYIYYIFYNYIYIYTYISLHTGSHNIHGKIFLGFRIMDRTSKAGQALQNQGLMLLLKSTEMAAPL